MKNWADCISYRRYGYPSTTTSGMRSEFTRDYDKIIFMSAFRRLQNKTQVFPLPGNVFVHNRLTHSLEVASVGRSIGAYIGAAIAEKYQSELTEEQTNFFRFELMGVIASACLAHDVGNPAFGHSGEKAISNYFVANAGTLFNGVTLRQHFTDTEWGDLVNFEGNANAFRLLTRKFVGKLDGGQRLMYLTLASIIKYPCSSAEVDPTVFHRKKYGYFHSDKEAFNSVMEEFLWPFANGCYARHPFVYLVEAADDICYRIIDIEDAHRIGILPRQNIEELLLSLLEDLQGSQERTKEILGRINDDNEAISYLRAKSINVLVEKVTDIFLKNSSSVLAGTFNSTLIDEVEAKCLPLKQIREVSVRKIYNHPSVVEVELAGYNVMSELLAVFVGAMITERRSPLQKKSIQLIAPQYNLDGQQVTPYEKVMGVLDFVSGMTDGYATELYRKIKGIDIPSHK